MEVHEYDHEYLSTHEVHRYLNVMAAKGWKLVTIQFTVPSGMANVVMERYREESEGDA